MRLWAMLAMAIRSCAELVMMPRRLMLELLKQGRSLMLS